jgi:hypothetical protein
VDDVDVGRVDSKEEVLVLISEFEESSHIYLFTGQRRELGEYSTAKRIYQMVTFYFASGFSLIIREITKMLSLGQFSYIDEEKEIETRHQKENYRLL